MGFLSITIALVGCTVGEDSDEPEDEYVDPGIAADDGKMDGASSVESIVFSTCSTIPVRGLSIQIVEELVKRKVRFTAVKEAIRFEGKQDLQTKVMIALFGLFAEVERDLISERTKEGLAAARARGRPLGRPKGSLGRSKLDGKEGEIRMLLGKEVSKASIAKIVGISRTALHHFIRTRQLDPKVSKGRTQRRRP